MQKYVKVKMIVKKKTQLKEWLQKYAKAKRMTVKKYAQAKKNCKKMHKLKELLWKIRTS